MCVGGWGWGVEEGGGGGSRGHGGRTTGRQPTRGAPRHPAPPAKAPCSQAACCLGVAEHFARPACPPATPHPTHRLDALHRGCQVQRHAGQGARRGAARQPHRHLAVRLLHRHQHVVHNRLCHRLLEPARQAAQGATRVSRARQCPQQCAPPTDSRTICACRLLAGEGCCKAQESSTLLAVLRFAFARPSLGTCSRRVSMQSVSGNGAPGSCRPWLTDHRNAPAPARRRHPCTPCPPSGWSRPPAARGERGVMSTLWSSSSIAAARCTKWLTFMLAATCCSARIDTSIRARMHKRVRNLPTACGPSGQPAPPAPAPALPQT